LSFMTDKASTHILAIWPHPDDVEVWCGGALYKSYLDGKKNVIIDCCPSQMSTRWNPTLRQQEAQDAARILGVETRLNMWREDTAIRDCETCRLQIAQQIRKFRPEIVLVPYVHDRHPDHEAVPLLVKNALFYAWLQKKNIDWLAPRKPRMLLQYMIWDFFQPDVVLGLETEHFDKKMEAFLAFESQHDTNSHAFDYIRGRAQTLGFAIKKPFWEWFKTFGTSIWVECFSAMTTWFF